MISYNSLDESLNVIFNKIAKISTLILIFFSSLSQVLAQQTCTINANQDRTFSTHCTAPSGAQTYTINVNNKSTITIDGSYSINGTLTINLLGSEALVIITGSITANSIVFTGSANEKQLDFGPGSSMTTPGTLNFNGLDLDMEGTGGTISAGTITGAQNLSCAGGNNTDNCPSISAASCSPTSSVVCQTVQLPVTLLGFNSKIGINKSIALIWSTASEENFHYFELARSLNGKDFDIIAEVASKSKSGYSNIRQDYSYTDHQPYHGLNYYRLTSVDYDGYTETFPMIAVQLNGNLQPMIFPNPVESNTITISGLSAENPYNIAIFTQSGQKKFEATNQFNNTLSIDPCLPAGMYIARIRVGTQDFSQKIIVK